MNSKKYAILPPAMSVIQKQSDRFLLFFAILVMLHGAAIGQLTNQITQISPNTAQPGTTSLLVTFTLDTDFPPPPPAGDGPQSVMIGSISGSSITHISQSSVTALFTIPAGEATGTKDVTISFSVPGNTLVFSLAGGFTVGTGGSGEVYNIERTLADGAQQNTIAFDGLAFLTGSLGGQSFLPPGKVADFDGFQYLRDNDPTQMGHNTDFVTIVAFNVLHILTTDQIGQLVTRAQNQVSLINQYAYQRFPLIKAFRRQLEGDIPTGSTGLSKDSVKAYSGRLYLLDGQISYDRAQLMGSIIRSLTADQKAALDTLKTLGGVGNWNRTLTDPLQDLHLDQDVNVAVMTYASEMYAWYAGSVEADTYFCPERQGTYFGSFYLKDWPAMGNPNYTINEQLTATAGENFLGVLTDVQASLVTGLVTLQKSALYQIVATRQAISTQLRRFMTETAIDSATVMSLSETYGELDGEIVFYYATHFAEVSNLLSADQKNQLTALADSLGYVSAAGAFLYSQPIAMPEIMDTDFLFAVGSGSPCGDANSDGKLNVADVVYLVNYIFKIGAAPNPLDAGDVNCDTRVNVGDGVYLINYIFKTGSKPCTGCTQNQLGLNLTSPDAVQGGALPVDYTCDGEAATLPLQLSGAAEGTQSYALIMHHEASPTDIHWYWVVYNIPPEINSISRNGTGPWTLGNNSVNGLTEYAPPCSQGPGAKTYIYRLYALSAAPEITVDPSQVSRDVLLSAMQGLILDSAGLSVSYTRPGPYFRK